jgi:prepilin-type N-terminal cleavage/methylation domain-containing protein
VTNRRRRQGGFTLLEVLIALTIVGALLVIAFGGMRVALAAWRQGEDRAEVHQHARGLAVTLTRALGAMYPYQASRELAPDPVVLFSGTDKRLEFVTQSPPFPFAIPVAFTAVVIALEEGEEPGLVIRQRALPNERPFSEAKIVLRDPAVTSLEFQYLGEGDWTDGWDGTESRTTPRAVKITLGTTVNGRVEKLPPLTVSMRTAPPL